MLAAHNAGAQEPVAYLHEMHMEADQTYERLTFDTTNAFGEPGRDYSESYAVTCTPLYAQPQPMPDAARDALKSAAKALQVALPHMQCDEGGNGPDCTPVFQALFDCKHALAEIERGEREGEK